MKRFRVCWETIYPTGNCHGNTVEFFPQDKAIAYQKAVKKMAPNSRYWLEPLSIQET